MKKVFVFALGLLFVSGIVSTTHAAKKDNLPEDDPLATITTGECSNVQIAPFGTSLLASWSWLSSEDPALQTKFGGDAVYLVNAETADVEPEEFEVSFGLTKYETGTPADAYPNEMVYRCSVEQTETTGECNGSVLGLRSAIRAAAAEHFGVLEEDVTLIRAELVGVYVKPMNPGKNGRQNYTLTDVCTVVLP